MDEKFGGQVVLATSSKLSRPPKPVAVSRLGTFNFQSFQHFCLYTCLDLSVSFLAITVDLDDAADPSLTLVQASQKWTRLATLVINEPTVLAVSPKKAEVSQSKVYPSSFLSFSFLPCDVSYVYLLNRNPKREKTLSPPKKHKKPMPAVEVSTPFTVVLFLPCFLMANVFISLQTSATTAQSPAITSTPEPVEKPKISDEVLLQYFTPPSPLPIDSFPIPEHVAHVEKILEILADVQNVNTLRISLFKLSRDESLGPAGSEAWVIFNNMVLQVGDVHFNFKLFSQKYESALHDLTHLREIQGKKSRLQSTYTTVKAERQTDLAQQAELNAQMAELTAALKRIQTEMDDLQPRIRALNDKINLSASRRIDLYTQLTSLDAELLLLLQQKEALEKDCATGEEELMQARKSWDGLRQLFNEAKEKRPMAETVSKVSQLDLLSAPLFSLLLEPHLAITSAAEPHLDTSQVAAFDAEGMTPSSDPPLDANPADPGALAGASAQGIFCLSLFKHF